MRFLSISTPLSLRRLLYLVLGPAESHDEAEHRRAISLAKVVDLGLICLIVANVLAVVLESEPAIGAAYRRWFRAFELISVVAFTLEYGLRLWTIVESSEASLARPWRARLRYLVTPLALADLAAILPFYLSLWPWVDLRMLRVLRLLSVLKLTRYSTSITLLLDALRRESRAIGAAMFVLFLLLMVAASLAYLAEHRAQPVAFGTIPAALWWAVVTMTTVGYGDVVPITPLGKLLGGAIAIIGIGMVALPAGLLASGFSEQLHERERLFEAEVERRLADGVLDEAERQQLIELRKRLGLRARDASAIVHLVSRQQHAHPPHCPHCGLPLTPAAGPSHAGPRAKGWQAW